SDDAAIAERAARLHLGYAHRIDRAEPGTPGRRRGPPSLHVVWEDSAEEHRDSAPDRRRFFLRDVTGAIREARGYRGGSGRGERRALPVADARLLVNLARAGVDRVLLDPFAGAGGIVHEATRTGAVVFSADVDRALAPGLVAFGSRHLVASATALPFRAGCI